METMPEPMTTVHDALGITSSNCFTRGTPGPGDGPVGPFRLRLTGLVCRDSRFMMGGSYRDLRAGAAWQWLQDRAAGGPVAPVESLAGARVWASAFRGTGATVRS